MIQFLRRKFLHIISAAIISSLYSFYAADDPLQALLAGLAQFQKNYPQENIYVQFDKSYYSAGDTIFFKAYIKNADEPNVISNILHIDIVNENNNLTKTLIYPATNGLAWGTIAVADYMKPGVWTVHAYTNWMRNFAQAYFFEKQLFIGDALNNNNNTVTASANKIANTSFTKRDTNTNQLYFFPEGGELVNGLKSIIGFKSVSDNEPGVAISGSITDQIGKKITDMHTSFGGLGSFELTPQAGSDYFANVQYSDGIKKTIPLPKALQQGYTLSVDNHEAENILIAVKSSSDLIGKPVALIAQSNNIVQYSTKTDVTASGVVIPLSKSRFPTGILQVTLFNAAYQPVAERIVFINQQDELHVNVFSDKTVYSPREKVQLLLDARDEDDNPLNGSFSVAVTDMQKVAANEDEENILSRLLLTGDLKGYIENPGYYFSNQTDQKRIELDNLLLTQGWRKFSWQAIIAGNYPPLPFASEESLTVNGKVFSKDGKPAKGATVSLIPKTKNNLIADTITDDKGLFRFDKLYFTDSIAYTIHAKDQNGNSNLVIKIDSVPGQLTYANNNNTHMRNDSSLSAYLVYAGKRFSAMKAAGQFNEKTKLLKEVLVAEKKATPKELATRQSLNLNGPGEADQVITYKDLEFCHELPNCLMGKLLGVELRNVKSKIYAYSTRRLNNGSRMLVIRDGVELTGESADLNTFNAYDIQSIEVLRSGAHLNVYGPAGASGVLVITTKEGGIAYNDKPVANQVSVPGMIIANMNGYYPSREFYSPDYENEKINTSTPDLRSTIFWSPNIVTNENGKAGINFFTAGSTGKYKVIVEGLSDNGKPGRQVIYYEVK